MTEPAEIVDRKRSHFDLCAYQDVEFRNKTTLLEDVELLNQPLIESRLEDIDLSVTVLGKQLNYPIIITGMTGGAEEVGRFNRDIASLAEKMGLGFGVGSQRAMLRHPELKATFEVRHLAPNILLLGNIGIAQARELTEDKIARLTGEIGADALCIHFNTAMEIIQEQGDHDFRGSFDSLRRLVSGSGPEIIIKETGCGFDKETGTRLAEVGIKWVDISGAGGTSWVGVETLRNSAQRQLGEAFWDWGIPTAASICELRSFNFNLIASGGIRTGLQAAKALALGAHAVGVALPVLRAYIAGGVEGVESFLRGLIDELRAALMLCGCKRVADLNVNRVVIGGRLLEWVQQRDLKIMEVGLRNKRK